MLTKERARETREKPQKLRRDLLIAGKTRRIL